MSQQYLEVVNHTSLPTLLTLPHKQVAAYPTGFVVQTVEQVDSFPFTVCPLSFCKPGELPVAGPSQLANPHDVIVPYSKEDGDLQALLYSLYELYRENHLEQKGKTMKRYIYEKTLPPRKIIIPCLGRKENLIPTLKQFQRIESPVEGYRPQICIVEHSPFPDLEGIAKQFSCEYLWLFLDPRDPKLPIGQFNKALSYDKAFLFGSPANWYLFHDNDVLVPLNFWELLDKNVERSKTKFLQPYTYRSLVNTIPEVAERLRNNLSLADKPLQEGMFYPIIEGAPGGSLYLHRERYIDVGGHDPNYCWGYGPEDLLFFTKLKLFEPIAYADDPPIEMIHLWHPTAESKNPFRWEMDWFVKVFFQQQSEEEKRNLCRAKKSLLEAILKDIEKKGFHKV
jgi:hypothetical protein